MIEILIIIHIIIGVLLCIAAGLTQDFGERFFSPFWMIVFGPFGILVWKYVEEREERR